MDYLSLDKHLSLECFFTCTAANSSPSHLEFLFLRLHLQHSWLLNTSSTIKMQLPSIHPFPKPMSCAAQEHLGSSHLLWFLTINWEEIFKPEEKRKGMNLIFLHVSSCRNKPRANDFPAKRKELLLLALRSVNCYLKISWSFALLAVPPFWSLKESIFNGMFKGLMKKW